MLEEWWAQPLNHWEPAIIFLSRQIWGDWCLSTTQALTRLTFPPQSSRSCGWWLLTRLTEISYLHNNFLFTLWCFYLITPSFSPLWSYLLIVFLSDQRSSVFWCLCCEARTLTERKTCCSKGCIVKMGGGGWWPSQQGPLPPGHLFTPF